MAALHCIVKLGGSALTDKKQLETIKPEGLTRAGRILLRLCNSGLRCIVVHGAGSFGHFQAKEFGVARGTVGTEAVNATLRHGLCATRLSVTKLSNLVVEALVAQGVPAVGISPFSSWRTAGGKVSVTGVSSVREVLDAGYVPVLHGDCVLDSEKHCSILSGDIIIQVLSREFSPRHVVFLMDVDGIYTYPPGMPGHVLHCFSYLSCCVNKNVNRKNITSLQGFSDSAELVSLVSVGAGGQISPNILTVAPSHDVTGGASLKLDTAVAIITESGGSVDVLMCNIASRAGEEACMTGQLPPGEGTRVTLASV
ncbi:uncharacterized protein O3C94_002442 isoform 1-T1 [Discoglossus pictus]